MARCTVAGRASVAPTAARGPSVYATAAVRPHIKEVGVFYTTTTGCAVGVARATTTGTQGAALTRVCENDPLISPVATAFNTHTADATVGAALRQGNLGAAAGSGIIWTFEDVEITEGTGNGFVIVCPTGTGQIIDFYIVWIE